MKKINNNTKLNLFLLIALVVLIIEIPITAYMVTRPVDKGQWILRKTATDEFGYGKTNIGTSGLYVYNTRTLLDGAGYVREFEDVKTNWELTTVVDTNQQTEYLIFKDLTTGNIAAVERRKYEEVAPEDERMYIEEWSD